MTAEGLTHVGSHERDKHEEIIIPPPKQTNKTVYEKQTKLLMIKHEVLPWKKKTVLNNA